jgi:hypothetical protein
MASMVACLSCKTVVWAYDHTTEDVRGVANMLSLRCPKCGTPRNFDGWNIQLKRDEDGWAKLHALAEQNGYKWEPDPNNIWREYSSRVAKEEESGTG